MKKIKILCICIILSGTGLFIISCFFIPSSKAIFGWCIGLASALIVLGLGYLLNVLILSFRDRKSTVCARLPEKDSITYAKEKAGYLVCKIMNLLLCINLLILNELGCQYVIMILGISLVLIQFLLDLLLQIIILTRSGKKGQD